jgi:uncharacterized protein (DUF1684 family)
MNEELAFCSKEIAKVAFFLAALLLLPSHSFAAGTSQWTHEQQSWRAKRAMGLQATDGWFSLVALDWLPPGKTTVGTAADNRIRLNGTAAAHVGILDLEGDQVLLLPPPEGFPASLTLDGKAAHAGPITDDTPLKIGTFTLVAIHRGDRFALRIKDAQAPARLHFHGLSWYPPDEKYRVLAKWIPYTPPHDAKIPTILGTTIEEKIPGAAEFQLDGLTVRVEPIVEDDNLFFILRDTTSRTTTYGAGRFLYTASPNHGLDQAGEVWLDFNRLQNPPCAYTPYATCPLPPAQNRLAVAIPAGEKRYHAE